MPGFLGKVAEWIKVSVLKTENHSDSQVRILSFPLKIALCFMIKLCIDCGNLLEEDGLRWCKRKNAGYDINPVDGSLSYNSERNHPVYEFAFLERQADFRCGTDARFFVDKNES